MLSCIYLKKIFDKQEHILELSGIFHQNIVHKYALIFGYFLVRMYSMTTYYILTGHDQLIL